MNRVDQFFKNNDPKTNGKALTIYYTCGVPSVEKSAKYINKLIDAGADIVELGVPFSDPVADGVVIQEAAQKALINNVTIQDVIATTAKIREQHKDTPIVLFSYYNVIYKYGVEKTFSEFANAGGDAVLIVDLPHEEQQEIFEDLEKHNLHLIQLVAPETNESRLNKIVASAKGFIYMVTVNGVTGQRTELPVDLSKKIQKLVAKSPVPVLAGFGISNGTTAKIAAENCDGVIVGSAIVKKFLDSQYCSKNSIESACNLVKEIKNALS
ncbi:tryptophan synthase subunit alpha [Lentisphaerota bacterium WC36G]|nr:tryptophan synthase subunit alpha [Lentisphaerae bacterium WC36]